MSMPYAIHVVIPHKLKVTPSVNKFSCDIMFIMSWACKKCISLNRLPRRETKDTCPLHTKRDEKCMNTSTVLADGGL